MKSHHWIMIGVGVAGLAALWWWSKKRGGMKKVVTGNAAPSQA